MLIALRKMYNASTKTGIALHKIGLAEPLISIALHGTDIANARRECPSKCVNAYGFLISKDTKERLHLSGNKIVN